MVSWLMNIVATLIGYMAQITGVVGALFGPGSIFSIVFNYLGALFALLGVFP